MAIEYSPTIELYNKSGAFVDAIDKPDLLGQKIIYPIMIKGEIKMWEFELGYAAVKYDDDKVFMQCCGFLI